MPHANIYIRKENEDRWESIQDKSAWVNERLSTTDPTKTEKLNALKKLVDKIDPLNNSPVKPVEAAGPVLPDEPSVEPVWE